MSQTADGALRRENEIVFSLNAPYEARSIACWPDTDFEATELSMSKNNRPELKAGDLFEVRLLDDTLCVGMFHKYCRRAMNSYICSFFANRFEHVPSSEEFVRSNCSPISIQFVTRGELDGGNWRIFGNMVPKIKDSDLPDAPFESKNSYVGARIVSAGLISKLLNAYHGLLPWDMMKDDEFFDKLLLPEVCRPPNIKLKAQFSEDEIQG